MNTLILECNDDQSKHREDHIYTYIKTFNKKRKHIIRKMRQTVLHHGSDKDSKNVVICINKNIYTYLICVCIEYADRDIPGKWE